jgi:hypothetical protein
MSMPALPSHFGINSARFVTNTGEIVFDGLGQGRAHRRHRSHVGRALARRLHQVAHEPSVAGRGGPGRCVLVASGRTCPWTHLSRTSPEATSVDQPQAGCGTIRM